MGIFIEVVLPVFLVFLVGFIIQKTKQLNIKSISTLTVYVLIPCLVFKSLYETDFEKQHISLLGITISLTIITIIIVKFFVRVRKYPKEIESSFILTTVFMNAGNYGSPIILFAFGNTAFNFAISFYVLQIILFNTLGVYYATRDKGSIRQGIKNMLKLPALYAVILALTLKNVPSLMPENVLLVINLLADGAVPIIMLLLGMQIANLQVIKVNWSQVSFATILRLVISPIIVYLLTYIFSLEPLYRNVLILLAAMPTAVNVSLYSIEFNIQPKFVSFVTVFNTLLSIITVPILLWLLN